jgi:hypothetical protein
MSKVIISDLRDFKKKLPSEELSNDLQDIINKYDVNYEAPYSNLVELWEFGPIDSKDYVIMRPSHRKGDKITYSIINGCYNVIQDKEKNTITMWPPEQREDGWYLHGSPVTVEAHYLGDIKQYTDSSEQRHSGWKGYKLDYHKTFEIYEKTGEIVGKNLIPLPKEIKEEEYEPAF